MNDIIDLDPALAERVGEVLGEAGLLASTCERAGQHKRAETIRAAVMAGTALLTANAALRSERDAAEQRGYANAMEAERKLHEDRIEALEAKLEKLREAADWQEKQRRDAFARRHIHAPEDPHVAVLCERYGYGAAMDAASRLWARKDSVGAFYIGGCIGIKPDAALTMEADNDRT